jgi:hypothetical protein
VARRKGGGIKTGFQAFLQAFPNLSCLRPSFSQTTMFRFQIFPSRRPSFGLVPDAVRPAKRMILRQPSAPSIPQRIMSASEFRIDVLGMPNNPPYGTSMSRITNIALVIDMAHSAMTMVLKLFGGARKPKVPNKMSSQNTKTQ